VTSARGGRLAAAALLAISITVTAVAPAWGHAVLTGSTPKDGASVKSLSDEVVLTFDENVAAPAFVVVKAPDGSTISDGDAAVLDNTVTQAVTPPGEAGRYTMSYRVVSADGHPITGKLSFTVTTGTKGKQAAAAATTTSDDSSGSGSASLIIALAALTALVAVGLLIRPHRATGDAGDRPETI
jgi:methionine-rich copper-binding protein CopC